MPLALVAMNLGPHLWPIYLKVIRPVLQEHGYRCVRAKEMFRPGLVGDAIQAVVDAAGLVIGDLTDADGGVFYHIGVAHAFGKDAILMTQQGSSFPFHLRHHHVIIYQDDKFGLVELKDQLSARIRAVQAEPEDRLETARAELYSHFLDTQRFAVRYLRDHGDATAYDRIATLTNSDNSPELIRDALVALWALSPDRALAEILGYRAIGNQQHLIVREAAVQLLGHYEPDDDLIAAVLGCLNDKSWGVRAMACEVLGEWRAADALPRLKDMLADPDPAVRAAAEDAIQSIGARSAGG